MQVHAIFLKNYQSRRITTKLCMSMQIHILVQTFEATESERADRLNKEYSIQQTKVSYKRFYENTDRVGNVPTTEPSSPAIIRQEIIIYKTGEAARVTKSCKSG